MNYKQLLILKLSGVVEWKNEKEMMIPEEMHKDFDLYQTCEFLGDCRYILREYHKNGKLYRRAEHQNDQRHGKWISCYKSGQLMVEMEYRCDLRHGMEFRYWGDERPAWEKEWENGKLIRSAP